MSIFCAYELSIRSLMGSNLLLHICLQHWIASAMDQWAEEDEEEEEEKATTSK